MSTFSNIGLCLLQAAGFCIAGLVLAVVCLVIYGKSGLWGLPATLYALALVASAIFFPALLQTVFVVGMGITVFSYVFVFVFELKSQLKSG